MSRTLRGLLALLTISILIVGVPLALIHYVGQPWPHRFTGFDAIWRSLRRGDISDAVVIKSLAVLLWISWARLMVSLLLELVARTAGCPALRVPGLGSTQQWAGALIAAVLMLGPLLPRPGTAAAVDASARPLPTALLDMAGSTPDTPGAVVHTVVVQSGDTLSAIAQHELGNANDWPELWDANRGRRFGSRTFDDPNLILTGWELVVPGVLSALTAAPMEVPAAEPIVGPIDSPTVELTVEPAGEPAGEPIVEPYAEPISAPAVIAVSTSSPSTVPSPVNEHPNEHNAAPTPVTRQAEPDLGRQLPAPLGLGGAVLVATGVVAGIAMRRRSRLRGATVGARLAEPSPRLIAVESLMRRIDRAEGVARLDIALRSLAGELVGNAPGVGVLVVMLFDDGAIEVTLTGPANTMIRPWVAVSDHRLRLPAEVSLGDLADSARRVNQPCPALAHLGSTPAACGVESAQVFVDLEVIGLLTIDAGESDAADVARAVAAGIAVSPLSEIAHLVTCGLGDAHLSRPGTLAASTLDEALDLAVGAIGTTAATTSAALSTFTLRARHQGGEAWEPAIVVACAGSIPDSADADADANANADTDLVALTTIGGRGLAVVVDRKVLGAQWVIEQHQRTWVLQPVGLELTPVGLSAEVVEQVQALLSDAERSLVVVGPNEEAIDTDISFDTAPSTDAGTGTVVGAPAEVDVWREPEWSLMVRLLGPVEVCEPSGRVAQFERSKALELVAWLSQHRDRSTRTAARTALWELNVRDATFANVVSDCRRTLARLVPVRDGDEWISRTLTEHLPLHRTVTTDADVLRACLTRARTQSGLDAITTLRPGLALVRDLPFFGTSYLWPDAEGITSHLTLLVTSSATVLAELYLSEGDIDGVFWATGQGLKVLAGHEELIALRMRAHARQGDLAGVRQEWESYERALIADTWSSGDPAPKLVALRRELLSLSLLQTV